MGSISEHASASGGVEVDDDIYTATVYSAEVDMHMVDGLRVPREDKWGKKRLIVEVELEGMEDSEGPIRLRRSFAISYGKNMTTGQPSALVAMIGAVMGMPVSDAAIRHVTTEQLVGKRCRIQTAKVTTDRGTFTNIAAFLPPPKSQRVAPAPQPAEPKQYDLDNLEEDLPF